MKKSALFAPALLAPATLAVLLSTALADVKYTSVMSMSQNGQLKPFSSTTTYLKEGLERIDSAQKIGPFDQGETTISRAATREIIHYDTKLKIYTLQKYTGARPAGGVPETPGAAPKPAKPATPSTGKLVLTLGAQFIGNEKLLNYPVRHWKDSVATAASGCCGTGKMTIKTETWRADIKLPTFNWPYEPNQNYAAMTGAKPNCKITFERKGDIPTYEKAQKGLALRSRTFGADGKLMMQQEITMLSFAALDNSVFAVPAGFKKLSRAQYDAQRQQAMMGGMMGGANIEELLKQSGAELPEGVLPKGVLPEGVEFPAMPATAENDTQTPIEEIAPLPATAEAEPIKPIEVRPARAAFDKNAGKQLLEAAQDGDAAQLLAALEAGADPNITGKGGQTALMMAASAGKSDLISKLIEYGANVNAQDKEGRTALMLAQNIGAPKPKKSGFGFGSLGKVLGGAIGDKIGGEVLKNTVLQGAAANLLGGMPLDDLLGANLKGLLGASSFNLGSRANWSAIIGTALQGDANLGGKLNIGSILIGNKNLGASDWVNLLSGVKGGNAQVLGAMANLGGTNAAKNALWNQFLNSASSGNLGAVSGLMKNPQLSPLLSQALSGLRSAALDLPQNSAHSISQMLLANGANAALGDKKGQTAAQLANARGWADIAALLK